MNLAERMADQEQYMGEPFESQCDSCARRQGPYICEAFPDSIPLVILTNVYDHHHPYDFDGKDDQGLTYIPKSKPSIEEIMNS
jgi:hypothetical protein